MIVGHVSQRTSQWSYGGQRRYFRLFIHPDLDHFRAAATRTGYGDDLSEASGCCTPAPVRERYDPKTETWHDSGDPHWAGLIRLTEGHINTEVVAHEMTHAALVIYRLDIATQPRLGNGCDRREERLAYLVGDLIHSATNELYRLNAW